MLKKFATAKNREKLNLLKVSPSRCYLPRRRVKLLNRCSPTGIQTTNLSFPIVRLQVQQSMTELHSQMFFIQKILRSFANHSFHEYQERTTPSQILVPCNLSSCRVPSCVVWKVLNWFERAWVLLLELIKSHQAFHSPIGIYMYGHVREQ